MSNSRRTSKFIVFATSIVALLLSSTPSSFADDVNVVQWEQIIGLAAPGTGIGGSVVGGVQPITFPWTAHDGKAWVHLGTGQIKFNVSGLVLATSTPLAVVGTIGVTTQVKGTLVCNGLSTALSTVVDSPSVPLDPQGNASFVGNVAIPNDCMVTPDKLAFLVRVAEAPGNPFLVNRWIAAGVVRTP